MIIPTLVGSINPPTSSRWYFSYYRLKQIDFDSRAEYSKTITVAFDEVRQIKIYPNPTSETLQIVGVSDAEIEIYDRFGRTIKELRMTSQSINVSDLSSGIYFLSIKTEKGVVEKRIIKN